MAISKTKQAAAKSIKTQVARRDAAKPRENKTAALLRAPTPARMPVKATKAERASGKSYAADTKPQFPLGRAVKSARIESALARATKFETPVSAVKRAAKPRSVAPAPHDAITLKTSRSAAAKRADPVPVKRPVGPGMGIITQHSARNVTDLIKALSTFASAAKVTTEMFHGFDYIYVHNRVGRKIAEIKLVK